MRSETVRPRHRVCDIAAVDVFGREVLAPVSSSERRDLSDLRVVPLATIAATRRLRAVGAERDAREPTPQLAVDGGAGAVRGACGGGHPDEGTPETGAGHAAPVVGLRRAPHVHGGGAGGVGPPVAHLGVQVGRVHPLPGDTRLVEGSCPRRAEHWRCRCLAHGSGRSRAQDGHSWPAPGYRPWSYDHQPVLLGRGRAWHERLQR